MREQNDEGEEAARVDAVDFAEVAIEVRLAGLIALPCVVAPPYSSSATPSSRSMVSCRLANRNSMTTKAISEPCAAM